jgi:hypothetical protein
LNRPSKRFGWRERSILAVGGLVIMASGYGRVLRGQPIFTNWQGFTVSADYLMFLGAVCLLVSILPWAASAFSWTPTAGSSGVDN